MSPLSGNYYHYVPCVFFIVKIKIKSRWLCYFQESKSTCQNFYSLERRKYIQKMLYLCRTKK